MLSATLALVAYFLWVQDNGATRENGPIENSQVFFLALAFALHIYQQGRLRQQITSVPINEAKLAGICHLTLAMLALSILVRELDIDKLGVSAGWHWLELTVRAAGVGAWLLVLSYVYRQWAPLWSRKWVILCTATSVLTGIGVAFYISSWFFDKSVVPINAAASQLWEETLQLTGTIFIFSAALQRIDPQKL